MSTIAGVLYLARLLNIYEQLCEKLRQYFNVELSELISLVQCKLCGWKTYTSGHVYYEMLSHLFNNHPDVYYRIEEFVLEKLRSRASTATTRVTKP